VHFPAYQTADDAERGLDGRHVIAGSYPGHDFFVREEMLPVTAEEARLPAEKFAFGREEEGCVEDLAPVEFLRIEKDGEAVFFGGVTEGDDFRVGDFAGHRTGRFFITIGFDAFGGTMGETAFREDDGVSALGGGRFDRGEEEVEALGAGNDVLTDGNGGDFDVRHGRLPAVGLREDGVSGRTIFDEEDDTY